MSNLERNKRNVVAFYDLMFNQCRPREAIERYSGDEYIQHNPGVADGKQGFIWSCPRQTGQAAGWCALRNWRGERIPRARCGCISL